MPKIPTFEAQGRPTAEVSSLKTQFKIPVESAGSMFGVAQKAATAADEYYVREQALKDKTESTKAYLELTTDIDTIEQGSSKILDPEKAQSTFKDQFSFLAKQKIDGMENKAAARLLEDKLSLDLITRSSKVVKGSRDQLDLQYNSTWNTEQQSLISKYFLTTDQNEKNIIKSNIDSNVTSRNFYNNDGPVKLEEDLKKSNASLFETGIEMDYAKKDYKTALTKLQDIESSKFLTAEKRMQLYQKGFKEFQEEMKIENAALVIENELGFLAKSGQLKDLKKEDLEKAMVVISSKKNTDGSLKYTQPQIAQLSIRNNISNPIQKEAIRSGYVNVGLTGNEQMIEAGYKTYRTYIDQGGRNFLETTMNLEKKEIEFYDRYDFLRSSLKYTQQQASVAVRDLEKNINTPEYKAKIVSDAQIKSATNSVSERWLSTNPDNVRFISDSITRVANTVYKIGGTEQQAVEYAKNFMDKNYRLDIFENLVPIKQNRPEYHDLSVKFYIEKLWNDGVIDKKNNSLKDLIAVDVEPNLFNDQAGIKIVNKKFPYSPLTTFENAKGDFDDNKFNSLYLTQVELEKKVYPVASDKRYKDFVDKFEIRKNTVNSFALPEIQSQAIGFGDIQKQDFLNKQIK
jgi:hypothetical protein